MQKDLFFVSRFWSISLGAKLRASNAVSRWQNPYTPPWDIGVMVTYVLAKDRSRVQISYVPPTVRKKYTKQRGVYYMKYYSEDLKRLFDNEDELTKAEAEAKKVALAKETKEKQLREERATRAKEVEDALKAARDAEKKANKLMNNFVQDYGSFHTTIKDVFDPFDWFWNKFIF